MPDKWTELLSGYIDDELTGEERAQLEAHLVECQECATILGELRRVVGRAAGLEDRPPVTDLWPDVARRIGARVFLAAPAPKRRAPLWRRRVFSLPELAAAATVLMVLSAGVTAIVSTGAQRDLGIISAGPAADEVSLVSNVDDSFQDAVADLQSVLQEGRHLLDSSTVRLIEENLTQIDRAIQEAREVLASDPASSYLNSHLANTMRRKLQLLGRANELILAQSL